MFIPFTVTLWARYTSHPIYFGLSHAAQFGHWLLVHKHELELCLCGGLVLLNPWHCFEENMLLVIFWSQKNEKHAPADLYSNECDNKGLVCAPGSQGVLPQ